MSEQDRPVDAIECTSVMVTAVEHQRCHGGEDIQSFSIDIFIFQYYSLNLIEFLFSEAIGIKLFHLPHCGTLRSKNNIRCTFRDRKVPLYTVGCFGSKSKLLFQGIYRLLAYSQGTSGLTTCGNLVIRLEFSCCAT